MQGRKPSIGETRSTFFLGMNDYRIFTLLINQTKLLMPLNHNMVLGILRISNCASSLVIFFKAQPSRCLQVQGTKNVLLNSMNVGGSNSIHRNHSP
jgi:hypothetical protein